MLARPASHLGAAAPSPLSDPSDPSDQAAGAASPTPCRHPGRTTRWAGGVTTLTLAAVLALLTACATPGGTTSGLVAPAQQLAAGPYAQAAAARQQPADAAQLATWWRQFDDPRLAALVEQALARNTSLRSAQATLREARAARAATEAATRPQVALGASASRSRSGGSTGNAFRLAGDASWEPDFSGAQSAGVQAAEADVETAQADLWTTQVAIAAETAQAYVQLRGAEARRRITQASLASFAETYDLARWRTQAGLASSLDLEQSRLNLENTRASLPALDSEVAQNQSQIALLTGRPLAEVQSALSRPASQPASGGVTAIEPRSPAPGAETGGGVRPGATALPEASAVASSVPSAPAALEPLAVGLPADLLRRRPDLRSAEAAVRAQWWRLDQTRRDASPSLTLSGSLGWQAATVAALSGPAAGLASLAASVNWSLFDGGQRRALVDQQDAALERSRVAYEAALLTALKDVEDSLVALQSTQMSLVSQQAAADAADNALLLTRQQHAAGLVDFATLLEAQRNALSARTSLQTGQTNRSLNLITLYKALGGGWPADTVVATQP